MRFELYVAVSSQDGPNAEPSIGWILVNVGVCHNMKFIRGSGGFCMVILCFNITHGF